MPETQVVTTEATPSNPANIVVRAETGKPLFTDSVADRIKDAFGGKINTNRVVRPNGEHFGRTIHEIDTDKFRVVLEDRDEFNRVDGEGATEFRYYQKDPTTKEIPPLLTSGATTLFSMQDVSSVAAGKISGTPIITFVQEGSTHNTAASLGRDGHLQVYINRNTGKK